MYGSRTQPRTLSALAALGALNSPSDFVEFPAAAKLALLLDDACTAMAAFWFALLSLADATAVPVVLARRSSCG
jgi:hypothetical protein